MCLAADPQNVSENFGAEILSNRNSPKHMLNGRLPLYSIPMKYKEFLAEKRREGLLFNKFVTISIPPFFNLLVC
jgi:hypothetical protein